MLNCHWKKEEWNAFEDKNNHIKWAEGELRPQDMLYLLSSLSSVCNHSLSCLAASLAVPLKSNFIVIKITWQAVA